MRHDAQMMTVEIPCGKGAYEEYLKKTYPDENFKVDESFNPQHTPGYLLADSQVQNI